MALLDRRIGLLFAAFLVLLLVATARGTWLAGVRGDDLGDRALAQQVQELKVHTRRGTITDRNGVELAVSEDGLTVFANPFLIKDPPGTARRLAPFLDMPPDELLEKLADRERGFVYLRRKLPPTKADAVEDLEIEGIGTMLEPRRRYPQGALASQVLGVVGTDNYGLAGLEQSYDDELHGRDGRRRIVRDALGKPVSLIEVERTEPGEDLQLTLDAAIQERVESVLAGVGETFRPRGATALVLDPRDGEVLAMANWPGVNTEDIGSAPPYVRQNRAVAASYEPGSTFKAFTVAGALEDRLIEPDTPFGLPPEIQVADRTIGESHARGAVTLTVADILAQSSNVGSVMVGLRLGKERFDHHVRSFGFGSKTGIELPGEAPGIVLKPEEYSGSSLGNLPIGQGIAVTPIQMAAGYSAIANGGVLHPPHLVAGESPEPRRVVSTRTAHQVARMLEGVLGPGGTAQEATVDGYRLAGKTGTAEKPDSQGGYSKTKFFASFIGFAPARNPRLLVAVMVDEPNGSIYGGEVAAPAFERIVSFALPYLRIPPE
jgi:cell division protein FtsI (penicillin-binding protein 3)